MDAPKCRLCETRHYGSCADKRTPAPSGKDARPAKKKSKPAQKHVETEARLTVTGEKIVENPVPIFERIDALEQIVDELLAGKKKRSEYMKIYMRDRRAREGG